MALSEHILDVDETTFENEVVLRSHQIPVVVDFWAVWCGPCSMLTPILERQAIQSGGGFRLAKVNVDENPNLAIRYGVRGIPAVKAFVDGRVVTEFVGAQPEGRVGLFIQNLVPSEADKELEGAQALLATRHWAEAEGSYGDVYDADDSNAAAALGLVKAQLMQGKGAEALGVLDRFPAGSEWAAAEGLKPLAALLAEVEKADPAEDQNGLSASLHQAARLIGRGNLPAAMDGLLDILRQDKNHRKGLPKSILLALFTLLGDDDLLTRQYREELASVLF